jgi:hypothetical protein
MVYSQRRRKESKRQTTQNMKAGEMEMPEMVLLKFIYHPRILSETIIAYIYQP